jgi:hypothetical protein
MISGLAEFRDVQHAFLVADDFAAPAISLRAYCSARTIGSKKKTGDSPPSDQTRQLCRLTSLRVAQYLLAKLDESKTHRLLLSISSALSVAQVVYNLHPMR